MICRRSGIALFDNRTELDTPRLQTMCLEAVAGWRLDGAEVRVRYSRGADFSGTCYYDSARIYVNLGRRIRFPYRMGTNIAKAVSNKRHWWRPVYTIELADAYQLVLFIFLHECFHLLVKRSARNTRRKESMCDRFAARVLVDRYAAGVIDEKNQPVPREAWDFQDLDGFVAPARRRIVGTGPPALPVQPIQGEQLLLFAV